jgi:hypothetical protein
MYHTHGIDCQRWGGMQRSIALRCDHESKKKDGGHVRFGECNIFK